MKFFSFSRLFGSAWRGKNRGKRGAKAVSAKRVRLRLEALEDRTVMSTTTQLPAPTVVPNTTTLGGGYDPQVVIDPLNHLKMVEVHVAPNGSFAGENGTNVLAGNYSLDGGQTWHALTFPTYNSRINVVTGNNADDPNTGPNHSEIDSFAVAQSPNVAFDSLEQFYIVSDQHDAGNTSGAIILDKFSFTTATPTLVKLVPAGQTDLNSADDTAAGSIVLYRWQSAASPVQDAAYNPIVAVDTNVPTYTDPTTAQVQTDTMANMLAPDSSKPTTLFPKAVYVAWDTNFTEPQNSNPATVSRIMLEASADGGNSFSTTQNVSPVSGSNDSAPQAVFTQGSADGTIPGGQLTFVWSTPTGIQIVGSQQDGGVKTAPVTATQDFTSNGGGLTDATSASSSAKSQTWTLAADVAQGASSLTVTTVNDTSQGQPPPSGTFTVTISGVNVTIIGTSGTLWTIQAPGAPQAFQNGQTVTFTPATSGSNPKTTSFFQTVTINPNFNLTSIDDLDVTINLTHPNLKELSVVLISPTGAKITLVRNQLNAAGNSNGGGVGVSGANMGNLQTDANDGSSHQAGTVFDDEAERAINDPTAAAPYVAHFRPESGTLASLLGIGQSGQVANFINGQWEIDITDFVNDGSNPPPQYLTNWSLHFTGIIGAVPFTKDVGGTVNKTLAVGAVGNSPTNVYGLAGSVANPYGTPGAGPGAVVAIDNTLGGFSPYQGRIYIAYTGGGGTDTNVFLVYSDDGGKTWGPTNKGALAPEKVNDDSLNDNFSEGNRAQFMPSIAVDQTNGAVVVEYYDARNDASNTRVANSIVVSNDGGADFSSINYLNQLQQATDFLTGNTVTLQPIPGNQGVAGSFGFGDRQGLAAYGGVITPIFATNLNAAGSTINTATVTTAAGPRVVSGDMGPITSSQTANGGSFTYDTAVAADGTQGIDGFVVTFDRPVDIASFLASDVFVQYQDPNTGAITPIVLDSTTPVEALDDTSGFGPRGAGSGALATTFYIKFAAPQYKVGTYSYAIGPTVQDEIRLNLTTVTTDNGGTLTVKSSVNIPKTPFVIQVGAEQMLVTNVSGATWTVTRSYNGTPTSTHTTGSVISYAGNQMDQNSIGGLGGVTANGVNSTKFNSITNTTGQDMFAIPTPIDGVPFVAGYDLTTLPIIIPGPHVISTDVPGQPATTDNLVLNATNGAIDILFDRNITTGSFGKRNIVSITGPAGPINLGGAGNPLVSVAQDSTNLKLFHVTFPTQTLSGTYNIVITPFDSVGGYSITDTNGYAVDSNLNAGLDLLRGVSSATNATLTKATYTNSTPTAIPKTGVVTSTISVPNSFLIEQSLAQNQFIQLELNINDNYIPDLQATLTSPDGKTVVHLFTVGSGSFGSGPFHDFANTVFDDSATNPITHSASPVTTGPYNPQTPLSALQGMNALGNWTLTITNSDADGQGKNVAGTLTHWELRFPEATPGSGLGEPVADEIFASFRIFTQASVNPQSSTQWTPVGPAANNNSANAGRIGGLAVDPSDPSGNTVFVAGASGGVWKTTDFLTTDANGPTYVPLTDLGPSFSLNVGSLAVFNDSGDPTKTVIFAATGEGSVGSPGVGFLRSKDGGATWQVLDSRDNVDSSGNILPMASTSRDRTFFGATAFKIVVDPKRLPDSNIIVYAAMAQGSSTNGGGLWRSLDSGNTWVRLSEKVGTTTTAYTNVTDVVLAPAGTDPNGNIDTLYAAVEGQGVFKTTSADALSPPVLTLMAGGQPPSGARVADDSTPAGQLIPYSAPASTPNGAKGRIVLATPAATNNPLEDTFYQGWVYAAVVTPGGLLDGLYLTKDAGDSWTKLNLPAFATPGAQGTVGTAYPTNNENDPSYSPLGPKFPQGNYDISLAIDPNDPNITYLGGSADGTPLPASGFIRVDATKLEDPYNFNAYTNNEASVADGGAPTALPGNGVQTASTGPTSVNTPGAKYGVLNAENNYVPNYLNLFGTPDNPFGTSRTLHFINTKNFNNDGTDVSWMPFDDALAGSTDQHQLLAVRDPLTGLTRLIFGDDQGVYTGVDNGSGQLVASVGTDAVATGSRNGNLQITQFYYGAAQPSVLAADLAGAMFYGSAQDNGFPVSSKNLLATGNLNWTGPTGDGTGVATDQTGAGTTYQYQWPCCDTLGPTNFFVVTFAGQTPIGRTGGNLIQTGDDPAAGVGQWPFTGGSNFAVNPYDPSAIVMSSQAGRIFRTFGVNTGGYGVTWNPIAEPTELDSTYAPAEAFGAPITSGTGSPDNFIYVGTTGGHVYVTIDGGGSWKNISGTFGSSTGLDGSAVQQIVTNPKFGSNEVYAVTLKGVYWMKDSSPAAPTWVNITGAGNSNLFKLTRPVFNNPNDPYPALQYLTTIQADWRYAIPDKTGVTHPILYVGGEGGVYRSLDNGTTWTLFPDITDDNASQLGGYLPNAHVTELNLVLGNFNPTTGLYDASAGLNMLVATTYGRGDFAIRLESPINLDPASPRFSDLTAPVFGPQVIAQGANVDSTGTMITGITLTFKAAVDPTLFNSGSVTVTGPNGTVALAADPNAVVDVNAGSNSDPFTVFRVNFATPQSAQGNYTITVGPKVYDFSGDQMDQDADNDAGEGAIDIYSHMLLFALPTVSTVPDQIVQPGIADGPLSFTIHDMAGYADSTLTVKASSNNQIELPNSDFTLSGTGANRTITITVPPGGVYPGSLHGPYTVTLSATDPAGFTGSSTFKVTIDNAPKLHISPNPYIINHGTATTPVNLGATDADSDSLAYGTPTFDDPLWDLQKQLGLNTPEDTAAFASYGAGEKWFHSTNGSNPGAGGGWYILLPDNTLHAWDGSSHATGALVADFKAAPYSNGSLAVYANPLLLTTTTGTPLVSGAPNPLFDLRIKYGLGGTAQTFAGYGSALWIASTNGSNAGVGQGWFLILPDNTLVAWDGVVNHAGGSFIADLSPYNPNVFGHPTLLTNAVVPTMTGVTASVSNAGAVTLTPTPGFDRDVVVDVSVTDGFLTTNGNFTFRVDDVAPTVPTPANVVDAHNQTPATFNLGATDPGDSTGLTYSVSVSGDNPLYDLQVALGLNMPDLPQYFNAEHAQEKWFQSTNGSNAGVGQGYYFLLPNNTLHAWNGQANTTGPLVVTAAGNADFTNNAVYGGANVYATPGLLYAAVQPAAEVVTTQRGPLYDLREQYGLTNADLPQYFNAEGASEKWFLSTNGSNPGAGGHYYFLLPNQQLVAWDGTAHATGAVVANLTADGDVYHDTALLYQAQPAFNAAAYAVSVQFGLDSQEDTAALNSLGVAEKWFHSSNGSNSAGGGWYYLKPDNTLHAWNGGNTDNSPQVATLPAGVYANTTLLTGQALAVTAAVSNTGVVTITPNIAFVGTVRISAMVSDGAETTTKSFLFTDTDAAPTFTSTFTNQSFPTALGMTTPQAFTTNDPNGDTLTNTATVSSPLYSLMQAYGLNTPAQTFAGYGTAEWIHSSNGSNPGAGGGWYFILSDNTLHAWNGTTNSTSGSPEVADFTNDPSYGNQNVFANPALLTSAQPLPSTVTVTFPTTNTVQVKWASGFKGNIWTTVFTSDGAEEAQQSFLVTVT